MRLRAAIPLSIAGCLTVFAVWLALPGRNIYGDPWSEELKQTCTLQDGTTARLYLGNGGATTAFWYTVTVERGLLWQERQIAFSYSSPRWDTISCGSSMLSVSGDGTTIAFSPSDLSVRRHSPLTYWRGRSEIGQPTWSVMDTARMLAAAASVAIAVWLAFAVKRENRRGAPNAA
jgi:hypothetical protein